jgi:hypothetical protein
VDDHQTTKRWAIAAASAVVPWAVILLALPRGGLLLLPVLAAGIVASIFLVELSERYAVPAKDDRR